MRTALGQLVFIAKAALLGVFIALFGQGIWSALVGVNLKTTPSIPWAAPAMAALLWTMWQYLGGRWAPRSTSGARRRYLRANRVPAAIFVRALIAGSLAIAALCELWAVMAQIVKMPGSMLPDLSSYRITAILLVGTGALVSPIFEQAGFWGYCQKMLEAKFSGAAAITISALLFALLPHPPMHAAFLPKQIFFVLAGATFGLMAHLTDSIVPGLIVHVGGLLMFFTIVWPNDPARQLIATSGPGAWFWIDAAGAIAFATLAIIEFVRLAKIATSRN